MLFLARFVSCSGVLRTIHTGFPRHSTVLNSPGCIPEISISTAAPAAFAFSDGAKVFTKGKTKAVPPTPPMIEVAIIHVRRSLFSSVDNSGWAFVFFSALITISIN